MKIIKLKEYIELNFYNLQDASEKMEIGYCNLSSAVKKGKHYVCPDTKELFRISILGKQDGITINNKRVKTLAKNKKINQFKEQHY